jgi:hypothetical protein
MAERGERSYPPVGDPERLDSIMTRGRALRRRRQLGAAGAGAGGALAVALVAVLLVGTSGGDEVDDRVVADDGTTTTVTTTTTPAPPEMTVELVQGPPAAIRVEDPAQPTAADAVEVTRQCITVAVHTSDAPTDAIAVAEGTTCAPGVSAANTQVPIAIQLTTSSEAGTGPVAEVGCAASAVRPAPEAVASTATERGVTTFPISAPDLAPGTYRVTVSAVSGIGDGCAPEQPGLERENVAKRTGTLQLP